MVLLPGHITAPDAPFSRSPILKFFASAIDLLSIGLRLNINQPGPEVLYQIISKRGYLPGPDPCIGFTLSALINCSNTSRLGGYEGHAYSRLFDH